MKKSTQELFDLMKKTQAFDTYMEITKEERVETTVSAALEKLLEEKNINKSKCLEASGLDRTYAYQIFSGIKTPSRDKLLALCLGMGLTLEETQTLLKQTGYPPLYPRTERDCAIIHALYQNLTIVNLNELLYEMGLEIIS